MSHLPLVTLLVSTLCLLPKASHADFSPYKCDGPAKGPVRAITYDGACHGFKSGDKTVLFARIASGTLRASKDGRTVVMIEDYLPGQVRDGKQVEALYDVDLVLDPKVLVVYRDGKRVAMYDLARLVKHLDKVQHSTSHIRWVESLPDELGADRFTLTTVTQRRIVFDTKTGKILIDQQDHGRTR
jgi:hypothetical protein